MRQTTETKWRRWEGAEKNGRLAARARETANEAGEGQRGEPGAWRAGGERGEEESSGRLEKPQNRWVWDPGWVEAAAVDGDERAGEA